VPSERRSREKLTTFDKSHRKVIADLVLRLWDRVEALEARVRELEPNPTRLPTATVVARLRRIAAVSTCHPSQRVCGRSPGASPVGRTVMPVKLCSQPTARIASTSNGSGPRSVARHAEQHSEGTPAHFTEKIVNAGRDLICQLFVLKSWSTAWCVRSLLSVPQRSPPPSLQGPV
jgi:hypothetical protein